MVGILEKSDREVLKVACCKRIIKYFNGLEWQEYESDEDEEEDPGFNILVEPLTSIISRSKENGSRLTSLSIMSIVNMCKIKSRVIDKDTK